MLFVQGFLKIKLEWNYSDDEIILCKNKGFLITDVRNNHIHTLQS